MKVWILECDHKPMSGMQTFSDDKEGTALAKKWLNRFSMDGEHYYDAVLYERVEPGPAVQNLESRS